MNQNDGFYESSGNYTQCLMNLVSRWKNLKGPRYLISDREVVSGKLRVPYILTRGLHHKFSPSSLNVNSMDGTLQRKMAGNGYWLIRITV